MTEPRIRTEEPIIEEVLDRWGGSIGKDLPAVRGHVYRMFNHTLALADGSEATVRKAAVAAAFHDLGIWARGTFDYLAPSCDLAMAFLEERGWAELSEDVAAMILFHHKLTPCRGADASLVEAFRKADLVDLSMGLARLGLDRSHLAAARTAFPNAGFHRRILALGTRWALRHPLNPLPMFRW
ncbi:MAG: phosphohydrolase [Deltaproteobacteria bacterium]|nr:phosphohydrolase [Deltaproteobacteria bacterium]